MNTKGGDLNGSEKLSKAISYKEAKPQENI
jgi:hypothetical protein